MFVIEFFIFLNSVGVILNDENLNNLNFFKVLIIDIKLLSGNDDVERYFCNFQQFVAEFFVPEFKCIVQI